jgi:peptidoglycan/LPS O-acetylase OafA/YrhL
MYTINKIFVNGNIAIDIDDSQTLINHLLLIEGRHVYWSISVEFLYYLISPFIVILIGYIYTKWHKHTFVYLSVFFLLIFSILGYYINDSNVLKSVFFIKPVHYFPLFLPGLSIAYYRYMKPDNNITKYISKYLKPMVLICTTILILFTYLVWEKVLKLPFIWLDIRLSIIIGGCWAIVLLYFLEQSDKKSNFFSFKPLSIIGKISYSAYLFHIPILYFYRDLDILSPYLKSYLFVITTTVTSYFLYVVFEKNITRLTQLILKKKIKFKELYSSVKVR